MSHKKFLFIRVLSMCLGFILNVGFIVCCVLAILNASNESLRRVLLPIIISFASIAALFCVLFGRLFCGFLCPLGFFQDILARITEILHLPKLNRDSKFMKIINLINRIFLIVFVMLVIALIVLLFFPDVLNKISIPFFIVFVIPIVMIILNSMARRFFCNVCPLGSFIGLFEKLSIVKFKKNPDSCVYCGACYEACPMRIKSVFIENKKHNINMQNCIYCGECIRKCPKDNAISISILNKTIYSSSKKEFLKTQYDEVSFPKKENK